MNCIETLPPAVREDLVRKAWYSHDARWYMLIAGECGFEIANRLNRAAVRAIGEIEARRLAKALGFPAALPPALDEFIEFVEAGRQLYVAPPLMEMAVERTGARSYAIEVTRCFVAENIERAGIAEEYDCAVFDRVQGWHEALGLPLEGELAAARCAKVEGRQCRRAFTVRLPGEAGPSA